VIRRLTPSRLSFALVVILGTSLIATQSAPQIAPEQYERAAPLRRDFQGLPVGAPDPATAIPDTSRFWYRRSVAGGHEFVVVDAETRLKRPAFDHARLAAALSTAAGAKYTAVTLPFTAIRFVDRERSIEVQAGPGLWQCSLQNYACTKQASSGRGGGRGGGRRGGGPPAAEDIEGDPPLEYGNDVYDGMVDLSPQGDQPPAGLQVPGAERPRGTPTPRPSPDQKLEALIVDNNVVVRPRGQTSGADSRLLSTDGTADNSYTTNSIQWSPDSTRLVAYRVTAGDRRQVHYVESSPGTQVQPRHWVRDYAKPGDALDVARPVLFAVDGSRADTIDNTLFANPYSLSNPVWRRDGRAFTFEYNERGHQRYRVIEVDGASGRARALVAEESQTFVDYRPLVPNPRDTGKKVRHELNDGREFIWMSERDGWAHLYLYDGTTGQVKHQITKGPWVVRGLERVDEAKRQIWFQASGMYPGRDPYFVHYYRINFDGTDLTTLTEGDGDHAVSFSSDMRYFVDTYSRVDLAPISELRRGDDGRLIMPLERGDLSGLHAKGWRAPDVFSAMGRDGKTDIWGTITRPVNFDSSKKYPVIESIYAGPQGSFVPKRFSVTVNALAELGFIVVQIDGMGTNNRSKAFHDVAFKNLADAGLSDRILWHKAVAAKYPWYDITRLGVFGTSAGGQNALGALLFHPEFYKVGVANSGCHDNRMDKIWWNEQWMSWPIGPEYAASSNVTHAGKLQGKLLLVYGELDTNVDPSSTLQVANALIRANKTFDLIAVPNGGHGAGGAYYQRALQDFFVRHLQGLQTPDWNRTKGGAGAD
jgi:dipeptidyl aminopeptidase/acylaminoacyl peptidase